MPETGQPPRLLPRPEMTVVIGRPPLWDEINAKFDVAGKPILFAFGEFVYNPEGGNITRPLFAHELLHGIRQKKFEGGVTAWWRRYLDDAAFRLEEEIPAHQAEYRVLCALATRGRNERRFYLARTAEKLASPLYG